MSAKRRLKRDTIMTQRTESKKQRQARLFKELRQQIEAKQVALMMPHQQEIIKQLTPIDGHFRQKYGDSWSHGGMDFMLADASDKIETPADIIAAELETPAKMRLRQEIRARLNAARSVGYSEEVLEAAGYDPDKLPGVEQMAELIKETDNESIVFNMDDDLRQNAHQIRELDKELTPIIEGLETKPNFSGLRNMFPAKHTSVLETPDGPIFLSEEDYERQMIDAKIEDHKEKLRGD